MCKNNPQIHGPPPETEEYFFSTFISKESSKFVNFIYYVSGIYSFLSSYTTPTSYSTIQVLHPL